MFPPLGVSRVGIVNACGKQTKRKYRRGWLFVLTVIRVGTMFAAEMLLVEVQGDAARSGIGGDRLRGHGGNFFHDYRDVRGLRGRGAPAERSVPCDEHGWSVQRIEPCESTNDGVSGVCFAVGA